MHANHTTPSRHPRVRWVAVPALLLWAGIAAAAPLAYTDVYSVKVDNTAGVALNLLANDQGTAPLTLTAINGTTLTGSAQDIAVTGGTVRVAAGGALSFVPDGSAIGTSSFSYAVTDSTNATADGNIKVFVLPKSLTPDTSSALQDTAQSGNVWSNDTQADTGFTITDYTVSGTSYAAGATATLPAGTLSLDATGNWNFMPAPGYTGAVPQISYTATRPISPTGPVTARCPGSSLGTWCAAVNDPNYWLVSAVDPATGSPLTAARTTPTAIQHSWFPSTGVISGQMGSVDLGTYTYGVAIALPEGFTPNTAAAAPLILTAGADDARSQTLFTANGTPVPITSWSGPTVQSLASFEIPMANLLPGQINTFTITVPNTTQQHGLVINEFKISGSDNRSSTLNITVTPVAPPNAPPVAVNDSFTTAMDTPLTISAASLLGNDSDPNGDTLTITSVQNPVNGTVVLNGASMLFTPTAGFSGTASYTYTISDGNGGTATATVTITIPPNPGNPGGPGNPGAAAPTPVPVGGAGLAALMTALLAAMGAWRLRQRRQR